MSIGNRPPKVRKVKSYSTKSKIKEDHSNIVVDVKFRSKTQIQILLHIYLVGVSTPVSFLVSDLNLDCWVRLNMKLDPNSDTNFFEFIQVSTLKDPTLLLSVQPISSIKGDTKEFKRRVNLPDLMQIPLLREWLNFTFVTELLNALNFPNFIEIYQNELNIFLQSEINGSGKNYDYKILKSIILIFTETVADENNVDKQNVQTEEKKDKPLTPKTPRPERIRSEKSADSALKRPRKLSFTSQQSNSPGQKKKDKKPTIPQTLSRVVDSFRHTKDDLVLENEKKIPMKKNPFITE